jgi:hypothetical protein
MFEGVDSEYIIHRGNICWGAGCNGPAKLGTLNTVPLFLSIIERGSPHQNKSNLSRVNCFFQDDKVSVKAGKDSAECFFSSFCMSAQGRDRAEKDRGSQVHYHREHPAWEAEMKVKVHCH